MLRVEPRKKAMIADLLIVPPFSSSLLLSLTSSDSLSTGGGAVRVCVCVCVRV